MIAILLLILSIFTSCRYGVRAEPYDLPYDALEIAAVAVSSEPPFECSEMIPQDWWILFDDEQLNGFIEEAFTLNPTLQAAHAKILLANAYAKSARAAFYPTINWGGDILREKLSETGLTPFKNPSTPSSSAAVVTPGGTSGIPVYFTQYETELTLNYDFDVWGKNRNTLRAAIGEIKARIADEAFSRLQLGIAVASVYYQLQMNYQREKIALAYQKSQEQYLNLVQQKVQKKLDNKLSLNRAKANLTDAKLILLQIQGDIAVDEYQLKTYLAGNFDEEICKIPITMKPLPKVPLPKELPLHLLAQRPDISAQLWLIESAGKQIDVARAGFYPDFNLSALFGFQTIHLHKLFNYPESNFFYVNPAFTLPIFDGGRLKANLRITEVNYDLAIYKYNELILNAAKEVLDGIALLRNAHIQLQEYQEKKEYQEESLILANSRLKHGISSRLDYLIYEENLLIAQDQEVQAIGTLIQSILSLIKALGGGYCNE